MIVQELNAIWSNYITAIENMSTAYRHRIRDRIFLGLHDISRDLG